MWALGIIFYRLVNSNVFPFKEIKIPYKRDENIINNPPEKFLEPVSPFIEKIIGSLLDKNWRTRSDAQSILEKNEMQVYI